MVERLKKRFSEDSGMKVRERACGGRFARERSWAESTENIYKW